MYDTEAPSYPVALPELDPLRKALTARFVRLRVSTKGMRIIDKQGIDAVLADIRSRGEKV